MADSGRNNSRQKTGNHSKTSYQKSGNSSRSRSTSASDTKGRSSSGKGQNTVQKESEFELKDELIVIGLIALAVFLFLCTIKVISSKDPEHLNLGDYVRFFMTGIFGITAYIVPFVTFIGVVLGISNRRNPKIYIKIGAGILLLSVFGILAHIISYPDIVEIAKEKGWFADFYGGHKGGGVVFGALSVLFCSLIGKVGTIVLAIFVSIAAFVMLTGKSIIRFIQNTGDGLMTDNDEVEETAESIRHSRKTSNEYEKQVDDKRMNHKGRGVTLDTFLRPKMPDESADNTPKAKMFDLEPKPKQETIQSVEMTSPEPYKAPSESLNADSSVAPEKKEPERESNDIHRVVADFDPLPSEDEEDNWLKPVGSMPLKSEPIIESPETGTFTPVGMEEISMEDEDKNVKLQEKPVVHLRSENKSNLDLSRVKEPSAPKKIKKEYKFPPLSLLKKPSGSSITDDADNMKATARRLEETLETFGVKVKVTDYSRGPAVTRYELHPEQGVKVSKILSLADDIKLNLAAADIRIEAPIPGKMAVGIEVPNQNSAAVPLRELLERNEFKSFDSNLAFAVGKDIGGQLVIADIAKMPHVLIAGATGSGKSVCINTLIMSILYKAHPEDVKLIMIDPKVVELNVYNGIPHLMLPVVTDPKKAAASLQWGVREMTERYKKFADTGCRDLKGYNQKALELKGTPEGEIHKKLPQIVIIVDELADLMMVASKEVEESICRLAQLARAAGIHLVIATQRPSVDVITGLIKANMPSRIAFSVSSGVDSRTILDTNGAEKLLGKGDMLFFPQGYTKPSRVQGAFVTDAEVASVVDFIKNQGIENEQSIDVEEGSSGSSSIGGGDGENGYDEYFADAGRFVIEKEKGSIGMLQRVFKIGFNRAARIMDQLEEAGVVGPEEGTKPRRILMTKEEFEAMLQK